MSRPLLGLAMVVKNEAATICETLGSVLSGVVDRWYILDTGSADVTSDLIAAVMEDIPGVLSMERFPGGLDIDFGAMRSRALALAASMPEPERPVFALMLSGDEVLRGGIALREFLEPLRDSDVPAVDVRIRAQDSEWAYPRITRLDAPIRYDGRLHESPVLVGQVGDHEVMTVLPPDLPIAPADVVIEHRVADAEARAETVYAQHVPILRQMLEADPMQRGALLMLGQSLVDALQLLDPETRKTIAAEAASYFLRHQSCDGVSPDEHLYSRLRYLMLAMEAGLLTPHELAPRLDAICEEAPHMAEAFLLRATNRGNLPGLVPVIEAASKAADVAARVAKERPGRFPRNVKCELKACLLAAMAAQRAARHDRKYAPVTKEWLDRASSLSGVPVQFAEDPPPAPASDAPNPTTT